MTYYVPFNSAPIIPSQSTYNPNLVAMRTNYALQLSQIKSEYLFNNFDLKKNKNHRTTDPLNP